MNTKNGITLGNFFLLTFLTTTIKFEEKVISHGHMRKIYTYKSDDLNLFIIYIFFFATIN